MLFYYRLTGFMYNNLQSLYKSVCLVNLMATALCSPKVHIYSPLSLTQSRGDQANHFELSVL